MPVAFVDSNGGKGWIEDDLTVVHYGQDAITESIEAFIEEAEADAESPDDVLRTLMIELPRACSIREIVRLDGREDHPELPLSNQ